MDAQSRELQVVLKEEEQKHRTHLKAVGLASWDMNILGTDEAGKAYEAANNESDTTYSDPHTYERICEYLRGPIGDPVMRRQLEVLKPMYLASQGDRKLLQEIRAVETQVTQELGRFRASIDGKTYTENDITDTLKTSVDSDELEQAWIATKRCGPLIAPYVLRLARLRNAHAQNLGFRNYYEFALAIQDQTPQEILAFFDDLHTEGKELSASAKAQIDEHLTRRYGKEKKDLRPWHYQNAFFQEAPIVSDIDLDRYYTSDAVEIVRKFFFGIGLPIDDILARSSLYEQEGKCQQAFASDMDREGDVRTLCNVRNNEYWTSVLLHEAGHGVYWTHMDRQIPYLLRSDAHTFVTEAVAILFGDFSREPAFLQSVGANIDDATLKSLKTQHRLERLTFANWTQVMVRFEQALYENPEQDLNRKWWDLVRQYQGIEYARDEPDWATKTHIATSPVYYHNYQLGYALTDQLRDAMEKKGIRSLVGNPELGAFLKSRLFDLGQRYRWDETVLKATGERLTPRHWLARL